MDINKTLISCIISSILLTGCGPRELTSEQKEQVESLKKELAQVESQISSSRTELKKYSSGIIANLIYSKTEILEANKLLIQQRINAIESGAKITESVPATQPNPELAASIKNEIDKLNGEISSAKQDASKYNGGLVLSLKLSSIAMQEQTLAMLEQKYLSAKYGLPELNYKNSPASANDKESNGTSSDDEHTQDNLLPPGDGPLGFQMGLSVKNIEDMTGKKLEPVDGSYGLYIVDASPKKNNLFETFGLLISPDVGLCQIRAVTYDINTDSYGLELKSQFDDLAASITAIYGNGKKEDFLYPGSIWDRPQDWLSGLVKQERVYMQEWSGPNDAMNKNEIESIIMNTKGKNTSQGYIVLQYSFKNNSKCQEEIENSKKSSL
ncbi:hypothetical protein [Escherichia coli]|uniref:hypothetical protein n=1 Tax=Escherichia coli TaxID=562 RepID=UPI0010C33541|nr:hypothetical protein [Escherichia coli]GCZ28605.1 hypothetical protein HmCmsJML174_01560 [Escherichia coli]GDJ45138.1 hypothetical protein BvCmsKSNP120_01929 [Escherichia coli]